MHLLHHCITAEAWRKPVGLAAPGGAPQRPGAGAEPLGHRCDLRVGSHAPGGGGRGNNGESVSGVVGIHERKNEGEKQKVSGGPLQ